MGLSSGRFDQLSFELQPECIRHACPSANRTFGAYNEFRGGNADEYMGDIVGTLNRRREQIVAMDATSNGCKNNQGYVSLAEQFGM